MTQIKVVILGAAGRDFHNFNSVFRDNDQYKVVAFTATQISEVEEMNRIYPPSLAGKLYPEGIPIVSMDSLEQIIEQEGAEECYFSYSDISYNEVMKVATRVLTAGAKFCLLPPAITMARSSKPTIGVVAIRTGCGKSQTARFIASALNSLGKRVAVIRHPMPYAGNIESQKVQKFEKLEDLTREHCTIEEREEYEHHILAGNIVFSGVELKEVLREAEASADVILWDGGNNDTPFIKCDLLFTVTDPHRAGHEVSYYPGEINLRLADVVIINKVDTADETKIREIEKNARAVNQRARILLTRSPVIVDSPNLIKDKRVLCVEDGPTTTHGEMGFGAAFVAAKKFGAREIVSPKPYAIGSIAEAFEEYPHLREVLPALGYSDHQLAELKETIERVDCDTVIIGTPIDLTKVIDVRKQTVRARYSLEEVEPGSILREVTALLER